VFHGTVHTAGCVNQTHETIDPGVSDEDFLRVEANDCPMSSCAAPAGSLCRTGLSGRRWAALITGTSPDPRAWDYWWSRQPQGVLRAKLKSGTWVAGFYGRLTDGDPRSYAAGFFLPAAVTKTCSSLIRVAPSLRCK